MSDLIALAALIISIVSLGLSMFFWRRQFRPIVTLAVRTAEGGNMGITYSLQIMNSGSIPAKNIKLSVCENELDKSLGGDATAAHRKRWIEAINSNTIHILQNGDVTKCAFGTSRANDKGFWKYGADIAFTIRYEGWFGHAYRDIQKVKIQDSASFTGFAWGSDS